MAAPTPERLLAGRHCLIVLERVLRCAEPEEGCALLLGRRRQRTLVLQRIWPCRNSWEPESQRQRHFLVDPREQLVAQRWARHRQLLVLGAAHSHPCSAAIPSTSDLSLCCGPGLMLIRSGLPPSASAAGEPLTAGLRAWWLPEPADLDSASGRQSAEELTLMLKGP